MVTNIPACFIMECVKARENFEPKLVIIIKESGKTVKKMVKAKKSTKME